MLDASSVSQIYRVRSVTPRRRCAKRYDVKLAEVLLGTGKVRSDTLLCERS